MSRKAMLQEERNAYKTYFRIQKSTQHRDLAKLYYSTYSPAVTTQGVATRVNNSVSKETSFMTREGWNRPPIERDD